MFNQIKQKQQGLLWVIIAGLSLALIGVCSVLVQSKTLTRSEPKAPKKSLTTGASRVNPQEVWVHDVGARMEINLKRLDVLEESVKQLIQLSTRAISKDRSIPSTPAGEVKQDIANVMEGPPNPEPTDNPQAPVSSPNQAPKGIQKPLSKRIFSFVRQFQYVWCEL